jgi:hypothetical protein
MSAGSIGEFFLSSQVDTMTGMKDLVASIALGVALAAVAQSPPRSAIAGHVARLTRDTRWNHVASIPVRFPTFHPQGMVKIGDTFFISSVEVTVPAKRFSAPAAGRDRDTGEGTGHLFRMDAAGNLMTDVRVGEGAIYHPGGMDYDGANIWLPVAEYRPNSRSIVYRVDPQTMKLQEVLRFNDHIGAVAYDTDDDSLHGVSWGSRRFYRWRIKDGKARDAPRAGKSTVNTSHYVDYQDCKYAGGHRMLCTGLTELRTSPTAVPFRLGGMDLIDLRAGRPLHQVPILLWTPRGLDMTHNPVWVEATRDGLRAYFMPEDVSSTLYIYEAATSQIPLP